MKPVSTGEAIEREVTNFAFKSIGYGCLFLIISLLAGFGCCSYYRAHQPKAVDWNMHGEEIRWSGVQPYEREKMASDTWFMAGVLLVLFSPVIAIAGTLILLKIEQSALKGSQKTESSDHK